MVNLQSEMYTEFDKDPRQITAFVAWLAHSYGLPQPLAVLDLGCGPGRMLSQYHALNWRVTGMEPDADFYQTARDTVASNLDITVLHGGFGDLKFDTAFDLITAVNNPFSYLLDVAARVDALDRVFAALKPGGVFFLELTNFLYKLQHFEPVTVQQKEVDGDTVLHVMENQVDLDHGRWLLNDQYWIEGQDDVLVKQHQQAVITSPELLYFLGQQGFVDIRTFNSYCARITGPVTGKTILVAAQKPR